MKYIPTSFLLVEQMQLIPDTLKQECLPAFGICYQEVIPIIEIKI